MLTLYRRKGSPFWYFDAPVNGKRVRVSTKQTVKREAAAFAESYLAERRSPRGSGLQELSVREALFTHYLPSKVRAVGYRDIERRCKKAIGLLGGVSVCAPDLPFHELTTSTIRTYRNKRATEGVSQQTIDHEIKVLSAAYHLVKGDFLVRQGLEFPMERPKGKPRYLLPEEEAALLADLDPRREIVGRNGVPYLLDATARAGRQRIDNYDLVVMLLDTGARFGEIANLTWAMVDTVDWQWLHIVRTKVDNESRLAMTERVRDVLKRRYADRFESLYVFAGWRTGGLRHADDAPRGHTAAIRRAMNRVGINSPDKVARFGRRDVRSLRDTFATKLRMAGFSLDRIQKLLGHASPQMTQKYAHLEVSSVSTEAVDVLNRAASSAASAGGTRMNEAG